MKVDALSRYALLGTSLALMLQTSYRFAGPIGVGELLLMVYLAIAMAGWMFTAGRPVIRMPDSLTACYLGVALLIITPMTLLSSSMMTPGSSFRDLIAYLLVCGVLLALPREKRDVNTMVITFLIVLFLTACFQYFFGGASAYYSFRFTGGAKNPNQLALYLAAAVVISACLPSMAYRASVAVLAIFFGIISLSDAFLIFVFVSLLVFIVLTFIPPRAVLYMLPLLLVISSIALSYSGITELLLYRWEVADEGGSRTQLYISAINAWMDTPFSLMFGHGAGSFSGVNGPFEMAEAHNTVFDLATVAGVFGIFLFPVLPLWVVMRSMSRGHRFAPAVLMGLIAFAFFHFVGRQPVFWVSLVLVARLVEQEPVMQRLDNMLKPISKEARV